MTFKYTTIFTFARHIYDFRFSQHPRKEHANFISKGALHLGFSM